MTITNYEIKEMVGQGGMATVYLAEHTILQKSVAIKILNKEYVHNDNIRKRFLAEARNLFGMSHPNIIKVTDLIDDGDTVAFVMEYIEGETLNEYIYRKGKLSEKKIKSLFCQMLDAVGYVHDQNLVHRDIKPSNFMITKNGQLKLLDFGIAKNTDTSSSDYTQTGTTQNMGTPMYMSPEQIKSTKDVTLQSDIYSLGVVLWNMVTGKKPYDTNTTSTFELQTKIVTEKLPYTSSIFDSIIETSTAKELNNRFKNCKEIKSKLDTLQNEILEITSVETENISDKTLVDTINDNTIIEAVHNSNTIPKPQINIPYTPPKQTKSSPVGYIVLGIIIIIALGVIISNNNHSNTTESFDGAIDSTAIADSTALVETVDTTSLLKSHTNSSEDLLLGSRAFGTHWIEPYGSAEITKNGSRLRIEGKQKNGDEYCNIQGYITLIDDRNFIFEGYIALRHHTSTYDSVTGTFPPVTEDKVLNGEYKFRRIGERRYWRLKQPENSTTGYFEYSYHYIDIFMK